jgi:hypothetical protein
MVVARPGGSDAQQPPASFPSSPLGAVDPLGVTSLRVPERITARDAESARTEVARLLSPHDLSVTANPAAFKAHLASGDAGAVRLLELGYGADVRIRRDPVDDYIGIIIPLSGSIRMGWGASRSLRSRTGRWRSRATTPAGGHQLARFGAGRHGPAGPRGADQGPRHSPAVDGTAAGSGAFRATVRTAPPLKKR